MCNYTAKYTYNNHGDTTLEYNDNGIELTFTGDMNCRDVLVYNGDACMEELMLELYTKGVTPGRLRNPTMASMI